MNRFILRMFLLLSLGFVLPGFTLGQRAEVPAKLKPMIIKAILDQHFEEFPVELEREELIIEEENLGKFFKYSRAEFEIVFLKRDELEEFVTQKGFGDCLKFSELYIEKGKVKATIESERLSLFRKKVVPLFRDSFFWEGKKESGKWRFVCTETIAVSYNYRTTRRIKKRFQSSN